MTRWRYCRVEEIFFPSMRCNLSGVVVMVGSGRLSVGKRGLQQSGRGGFLGFGFFLLLHVEVWKSCEVRGLLEAVSFHQRRRITRRSFF